MADYQLILQGFFGTFIIVFFCGQIIAAGIKQIIKPSDKYDTLSGSVKVTSGIGVMLMVGYFDQFIDRMAIPNFTWGVLLGGSTALIIISLLVIVGQIQRRFKYKNQ